MDENNMNLPSQQENGTAAPQRIKSPRKKKKKHSKIFLFFKKLLTVIATTLLSLLLVIIITGTIVSTALTVYVLDFMDDSTSITLQELESGSDTYFYGLETNAETGEKDLVVLNRVKTDVQRIPVSIDRVPQHVRNAFVYTEDERFYSHDGVDYKRTFSAFVNMFMHIYDTEQGGSTITQQLIKNLTGDDEHSPQRKIREIFSAMQLEKTYTKDEILEEYLNYIAFGGPVNGIQLASIRYFGKNVEDLTVPEAAVLAAIPKSPEYYGPFVEYFDDEDRLTVDGRANNKLRQQYVLYKLYENGAITYDEYQEYLNAKLVYTDSPEYLASHPEATAEQMEQEQTVYSWVVDAMYFEAADFFMEQFNIDQSEAIRRINKGGYKIYSSVDDKMQKYVEERFLDLNNLISADYVRRYADIDGDGENEEYLPHAAFIAMNYDGEVMALVGDWGEKKDSLVTNYAVTDRRQVGSTMKPVATYGLALETDTIHWGSTFRDEPVTTLENGDKWPYNYGKTLTYGTYNVYYFLQRSYNTLPAQLCQMLTPHEVYKFCTENMGLKLVPEDEALSPLALGSLTYGVTLENLVNAYLPYGNEGVYNEAHIITRIEDSNQRVIYQNDGNSRQAVSDETAWVMNRLLKNVVDNGTGTTAKLSNKVVVGKTGTTENWYDEAFVGLTRDFVSGITVGYKYLDDRLSLPSDTKSAQIWNNAIGEYANTQFLDTPADFEPVKTVIESAMCTASGNIAGPYCPKGITGYWKSSNKPTCTGNHYSSTTENASNSTSGGETTGGNTAAAAPSAGTDNGAGAGTGAADNGNSAGDPNASINDNSGGGGGDTGAAAPADTGGGGDAGAAAAPVDAGGGGGGEAAE